MSDRELLEKAAKSAGINVWMGLDEVYYSDGFGVAEHPWNPLTDDGDALRLAVSLRLTVGEHLGARYASHPPCPDDFEDGRYPIRIAQMDATDPYAATRRAIVRAAAALAGDQT